MSYTSFVYDLRENITPEENIKAKCLVHFRPKVGWNGEGYGFDWMRIGDTREFGDEVEYEEIVSEQFNRRTNALETDVNEHSGHFRKSELLYSKLKEDYHPLSIPWRRRQANSGATEFEQYFCSWLSLYPTIEGDLVEESLPRLRFSSMVTTMSPSERKNIKAELRLFLDIEEVPDRLEFGKSDSIDITPAIITSGLRIGRNIWKNGKTITIECNFPLLADEKVDVYAIKKNVLTGNDDRQLAGRLYLWSNFWLKRKKKSVVLVEVNTNITGKGIETGSVAGQQALFEMYFNQSLIEADVKIESLDVSDDPNFREGGLYVKGDNIISFYARGVPEPPGFKPVQFYLYEKLKEKLVGDGKSSSLYDNSFVSFYLDKPGGECHERTVMRLNGYSFDRFVVLFPGRNDQTAAHEFYHSFKLSHSFTNVVNRGGFKTLCTYKAFATENLMDYSRSRYALWHWQWVEANRNAARENIM